jgi:hypothetical protein
VTVSTEQEVEIRRLYYAEHWKVGTIASQSSVHADVVRRVLGLLEREPGAAERPVWWSHTRTSSSRRSTATRG